MSTYFTALLGVQVAQAQQLDQLVVHAIAVIVIVSVITSIWIAIQEYAKRLELEEQNRIRVLNNAHVATDTWITQNIDHHTKISKGTETGLLVLYDPAKSIALLIRHLYTILEQNFAIGIRVVDRIDFEVTFMTESYLDGYITIAAWANRDNRKPKSLNLRTNQPTIYDNTVAATLYRSQQPQPEVIEDTSDKKYRYEELYHRQLERIKSSLVYPVLSGENKIIGVLIAHCDKTGFFRDRDLRYWRELFEIFSKRIVLEKCRLDEAIKLAQTQGHVDKPF